MQLDATGSPVTVAMEATQGLVGPVVKAETQAQVQTS